MFDMSNLDQMQLGLVLSQDRAQTIYTILEQVRPIISGMMLTVFNNIFTIYEKLYVHLFQFFYDMIFTVTSIFFPDERTFNVVPIKMVMDGQ